MRLPKKLPRKGRNAATLILRWERSDPQRTRAACRDQALKPSSVFQNGAGFAGSLVQGFLGGLFADDGSLQLDNRVEGYSLTIRSVPTGDQAP